MQLFTGAILQVCTISSFVFKPYVCIVVCNQMQARLIIVRIGRFCTQDALCFWTNSGRGASIVRLVISLQYLYKLLRNKGVLQKSMAYMFFGEVVHRSASGFPSSWVISSLLIFLPCFFIVIREHPPPSSHQMKTEET